MKLSNNQAPQITKKNWMKHFHGIKQEGLFVFLWLSLRYILRHVFKVDWQKILVVERSLSEPIQEFVPKNGIVIKQFVKDNLYELKSIAEKRDKNKYLRFRQRFEKGHICFVALDRDEVVGYCWASVDSEYIEEYNSVIKLEEGEVYFYDAYVLDEYRNTGISYNVATRMAIYFRDNGYKTSYAYITYVNIPAMKIMDKTRGHIKQSLSLFTIFGLKYIHRQ